MTKIRLWLDDIREAPPGWTWAKTAQEAVAVLEAGGVEQASLDHDLGWCSDCRDAATPAVLLCCPHVEQGMVVAEWMARNPGRTPRLVVVHSWNRPAAERMKIVIEQSGNPVLLRPLRAI